MHPNTRVEPQPGGHLYVSDTLRNREEPHPGEPSVSKWAEQQRRTSQRLEKDSYRAIAPVAEAVHVSAHLALPGSPRTKQLCHLHAQGVSMRLQQGLNYLRQANWESIIVPLLTSYRNELYTEMK